MYKILLLVVFLGGTYYYFGYSGSSVEVESYHALLEKVESNKVSREEVKAGSNLLATSVCSDTLYQGTGGKTVNACLQRYADYRDYCEKKMFDTAPEYFTGKPQVMATAKSFIKCVGAST